MRHLLLSSLTMAPSSLLSLSKTSPTTTTTHHHKKPSHSSNPNPSSSLHSSSSSLLCRHSPSATLDLLIFILVLFSGTFLITSYFSYIFQSLSLLLPSLSLSSDSLLRLLSNSPIAYFLGFALFFLIAIVSFEICCGHRSRKCENPRCKGMKKAMEFDLQLQTEECLRSASASVKEIDGLPWKGGSEANPDYECLRAELRKMAPPNGRAALLFRARCGCPIAKLEGWGTKRGRRHKKGLALNGRGDYC
ncbi:Ribosomal protein L34Ae protein [Actinidia chinensis var. chinensis]|uniref:Ribosomal protein L34Ae protein n=1 Tax=Actinidia chinensis var. chinensis TaxID=1590841 RepID=A0A2R6RV56_ACTCC|nr:Ribosomal protein L34Ae protein [Actinidia chinensis var. chinensis]